MKGGKGKELLFYVKENMSDDVEIIYQDKEGKCIIVKMVIGGENVFFV